MRRAAIAFSYGDMLPNAALSASLVISLKATARDGLRLTIAQFVTGITAKARRSAYTTSRVHDRKGVGPMTKTKIILSVVAALAVTIGALTITGAGDDRSSTPTIATLPLLY
jgi:hypothetical protein